MNCMGIVSLVYDVYNTIHVVILACDLLIGSLGQHLLGARV